MGPYAHVGETLGNIHVYLSFRWKVYEGVEIFYPLGIEGRNEGVEIFFEERPMLYYIWLWFLKLAEAHTHNLIFIFLN